MNIDKLKEAITVVENIKDGCLNKQNCLTCKSQGYLIDLARAYIKAMESGLPERKQCGDGNGHKKYTPCCGGCLSARSFNECYDLMLPHIVSRDMKIKELEERLKEVTNGTR